MFGRDHQNSSYPMRLTVLAKKLGMVDKNRCRHKRVSGSVLALLLLLSNEFNLCPSSSPESLHVRLCCPRTGFYFFHYSSPYSILSFFITQSPPPSLREILAAYRAKGDGDRDMLLAMLNAKAAEDQVSSLFLLDTTPH
jgi:hypothetical protein